MYSNSLLTPIFLFYTINIQPRLPDMFSGKRLLALGFILLLLIATPAVVYFVQQQQNARSRAEASTTLAFYGDENLTKPITQPSPLTKNVGDTFPVVIAMDPGQNLVASVVLRIKYDPTKLEVVTTDTTKGFVRNISAFPPEPIEGPKYDPANGEVAVWITTGTDVTSAIQAPNKPRVGTVTFKAIATTGSTPTQVSMTTDTQVNAWGSNATAGENVLLPTTPAFIVINGEAPAPSTAPSTAPSVAPSQPATSTAPIATPTIAFVTATPTPAPIVIDTPTPTLAETGPGELMIGMGAIAGLMMVIGAFLFFVL